MKGPMKGRFGGVFLSGFVTGLVLVAAVMGTLTGMERHDVPPAYNELKENHMREFKRFLSIHGISVDSATWKSIENGDNGACDFPVVSDDEMLSMGKRLMDGTASGLDIVMLKNSDIFHAWSKWTAIRIAIQQSLARKLYRYEQFLANPDDARGYDENSIN